MEEEERSNATAELMSAALPTHLAMLIWNKLTFRDRRMARAKDKPSLKKRMWRKGDERDGR